MIQKLLFMQQAMLNWTQYNQQMLVTEIENTNDVRILHRLYMGWGIT